MQTKFSSVQSAMISVDYYDLLIDNSPAGSAGIKEFDIILCGGSSFFDAAVLPFALDWKCSCEIMRGKTTLSHHAWF